MGALQKINGQKSGQYRPLSQGTSLAHNPVTILPSISTYKKHHHAFRAGLLNGKKPAASLISKKGRSHPTGKTSFTAAARAVPYHHCIHLGITDARKENWPEGYILQLPDPELKGVQPLVRIDDHVANGDGSIVPAHERIRREEIMSRWKVKIGSYLGNLHTGATEGSSGMSDFHNIYQWKC
jgi:hypothetical protein